VNRRTAEAGGLDSFRPWSARTPRQEVARTGRRRVRRRGWSRRFGI